MYWNSVLFTLQSAILVASIPLERVVAKEPVPLPVTAPVRVIVWSQVFVPLVF